MHSWLVLVHIVGAFLFVISHGASMWMAVQVSHERDPRRIGALLDLSSTSLGGMYVGLLLLLVGGVWAAIDGGFFARGWPWAALALLIAITIAMYAIATRFFRQLRAAVGIASGSGRRDAPVPEPLGDEAIVAIARQSPVVPLAVVGFGGLVMILWLMVFKPF
jgi:hypothetical protein